MVESKKEKLHQDIRRREKEFNNERNDIEARYEKVKQEATKMSPELSEKFLLEQKRIYLGELSDFKRRHAREKENIEKELIEQIKQDLCSAENHIYKQYQAAEKKYNEKFIDKNYSMDRTYKNKYVDAITELKRKIKKLGKTNKINTTWDNTKVVINTDKCTVSVPMTPPYIPDLLKEYKKGSECDDLTKIREVYKQTKIKLNKEYKNQVEMISKGVKGVYSTANELDVDYTYRCDQQSIKHKIHTYLHINSCKKCSPTNFRYIKQGVIVAEEQLVDEIMKAFHNNVANIFLAYYKEKLENINQHEGNIVREQYLVMNILWGEKVWSQIKARVIIDKDFGSRSDDEKMECLKKIDKKFCEDFPIVGRYMMCCSQYNRSAFKKFLYLLYANKSAGKGMGEDVWIDMQAKYVQYLYEESSGVRIDEKTKIYIVQKTRELLKKEFTDFKNLYKEKAKVLNEEAKVHTAQLSKELTDRVALGQNMSKEDLLRIYVEHQNALYLKHSKATLLELKAKVKLEPYIGGGFGKNEKIIPLWTHQKNDKENKGIVLDLGKGLREYYKGEFPDDLYLVESLINYRYLYNYKQLLFELKNIQLVQPLIEGYGNNENLQKRWEQDNMKWKEEAELNKLYNKIHLPYFDSLIRMYYNNNEKCVVCF